MITAINIVEDFLSKVLLNQIIYDSEHVPLPLVLQAHLEALCDLMLQLQWHVDIDPILKFTLLRL